MTKEFDNLTSEVADLTQELRIGYVNSRVANIEHREIIFAIGILRVLNNHHKIIGILSNIIRKDLINNIHTHHLKYINQLEKEPKLEAELKEFNLHFQQLKTNLSQEQKFDHQLGVKELDKLCKILAETISKIQGVFAEQNHNDDDIDHLIAESIVMQIPGLKLLDIEALTSNLLVVKELWRLDSKKSNLDNDKKVIFLRNVRSEINSAEFKGDKNFAVILKIIDHLMIDNQIMVELTDQDILSLYNRIKNDDVFITKAFGAILRIYKEAKIRFSCSRLSDDGYQILEKFQKFESIIQQIDDFQNNFIEKYFVSNNYLGHALVHVNKHTENICALKITNDNNFISFLDKIDTAVRSFKVEGGNPQIRILEKLRSKLSMALDANISKKYSVLDNFQTKYIRDRYIQFFENALSVIEEKEGYKDYLAKALNYKLAHDYYLPNVTNSVDKIRSMTQDIENIEQTLNEITLINVFHVFSGNNIDSLDFRKNTMIKGIKTPQEYVSALIKSILSKCSAFQLEAIYKPLIDKQLNKTEQLLKKELIHQIHIRTSISQMLISLITGKKKEYKKLKELKKS